MYRTPAAKNVQARSSTFRNIAFIDDGFLNILWYLQRFYKQLYLNWPGKAMLKFGGTTIYIFWLHQKSGEEGPDVHDKRG
jgi:hypothetical protein